MNEQYIRRLEKALEDAIQLTLTADKPISIHRAQGRVRALQEALQWARQDDPKPRATSKAFA